MRCSILKSIALCFSILVCLTIGPAGAANKKAKEGQITGTVHMIDKDKSTLVVMKGNTQREVIYNSDTKWMYGTQASNKPSSLDELKENWSSTAKARSTASNSSQAPAGSEHRSNHQTAS